MQLHQARSNTKREENLEYNAILPTISRKANTYKLGPFSSWPAMRSDTPKGLDCIKSKIMNFSGRLESYSSRNRRNKVPSIYVDEKSIILDSVRFNRIQTSAHLVTV